MPRCFASWPEAFNFITSPWPAAPWLLQQSQGLLPFPQLPPRGHSERERLRGHHACLTPSPGLFLGE